MFIPDILIDQSPNTNPDSADQYRQRYRGIDKVIKIHMRLMFGKFLIQINQTLDYTKSRYLRISNSFRIPLLPISWNV